MLVQCIGNVATMQRLLNHGSLGRRGSFSRKCMQIACGFVSCWRSRLCEPLNFIGRYHVLHIVNPLVFLLYKKYSYIFLLKFWLLKSLEVYSSNTRSQFKYDLLRTRPFDRSPDWITEASCSLKWTLHERSGTHYHKLANLFSSRSNQAQVRQFFFHGTEFQS